MRKLKVTITIPVEDDRYLLALAQQTKRSRSYWIQEAVTRLRASGDAPVFSLPANLTNGHAEPHNKTPEGVTR